ncbi:HAD-IB family phosphatase [Patescibacteria group bacterium AH-259-L05]|nr:HAD-IB family phosphatase [Patescibacteria group bacterium AH-259-L05]
MVKKNKKLVIFDVDGVLLDNTMGGFKEILVILGKRKQVQILDREYQKRKYQGPWGLEELAKLYKDFSKDKLNKLALEYCSKNLMKGAKEVIDELKNKNYMIGALSTNSQFIMQTLTDLLGLDFSYGTELEYKHNKATGKIYKKVDRYTKAEILKEKIKQFSLHKTDIIVVGDSVTDLPMAELAGLFIAFNPKERIVKECGDVIIQKKDLKGILQYINS